MIGKVYLVNHGYHYSVYLDNLIWIVSGQFNEIRINQVEITAKTNRYPNCHFKLQPSDHKKPSADECDHYFKVKLGHNLMLILLLLAIFQCNPS